MVATLSPRLQRAVVSARSVRMTFARGLALLSLFLASGIGAQASRASRAPPPDEASLHAAYVINFIRYSKWPTTGAAAQPYVIAVLGPPESAVALRRLCERAGPVEGRAIVVHALTLNSVAPAPAEAIATLRQELGEVNVVYLAESHRGWNRVAIAAVAGRPVLTVGVGSDFVEAGGMFGLMRNGSQVTFSANEPVIRRNPVDVSARVLMLARPPQPVSP